MEIRPAALNDLEPIYQHYNEFFAYNTDLQPEHSKAGEEKGGYPKSVITSDGADIILAVENTAVVWLIYVREAQTPPFDAIAPQT